MPSSVQSRRSRGWCWTLNNPTEEEIVKIQAATTKFTIYGHEVGESGTPHLQGYSHFVNACSLGHVKAMLGQRLHAEERKGTLEQAVNYCKKDGKTWEKGVMRATMSNKWKDVIALAEAGKLDVIKEDYPGIFFLHLNKIRDLMNPSVDHIRDDLKEHFEWWYGPTGTGKSRRAWEEYPHHYDKAINKWWDGYNYEECVVIEEADPTRCEHMAYFFKRWCDHYPFRAEVKNGHLHNIRPIKIIVTSNFSIKECFPKPEDHDPLLRRFKVTHFPFATSGPQQSSEVIQESSDSAHSSPGFSGMREELQAHWMNLDLNL